MDRHVEDVNAYISPAPGILEKIGRGVTHYTCAWVDGISGGIPNHYPDGPTHLTAELIAAGLPDTTTVLHRADSGLLDVAVLLDDGGAHQAAVEATVAAHIAAIGGS